MSDLEAVPNPVIHSCQILDPGRDVRRIEIVSEELKRGRQMGYSRAKIVDADQPGRVLALTEGQGVSIGTPPEGLERMEANPLEVVDSPDLPPLWQVFGGHRRPDGHWALAGARGRGGVAGRRAAHRTAVRHRWRPPPPMRAAELAGTDASKASRRTSCSSRVARRARSASRPNRCSAPTACSPCGSVMHDEGTMTASPRWGRTCSAGVG